MKGSPNPNIYIKHRLIQSVSDWSFRSKYSAIRSICCGVGWAIGQRLVRVKFYDNERYNYVHEECAYWFRERVTNKKSKETENEKIKVGKVVGVVLTTEECDKALGSKFEEMRREDERNNPEWRDSHKALKEVMDLAKLRENILLIGPAGCGKSYLAREIAEKMGLDFGEISVTVGMSESQLLGKLLPVGRGGGFEYCRSDFVRMYEEGGVFLLDEIDGADPNVMLIIHEALGGFEVTIPNRVRAGEGKAIRHKDFVCVAAANTYGRGANRLYVGRNQLDEATLDRFRIGQIEMDYDERIDEIVCPDEGLRELLLKVRRAVEKAELRRIVSSRFFGKAYKLMEGAKWTKKRILEGLFCGWSTDEINKVKTEMGLDRIE